MRISELTNNQAEQEIIGGLLNFHDSFVEIHDILTPTHFFKPEHGALFQVFAETYKKDAPVDLHTLCTTAKVDASIAVECMDAALFGAQKRTAQRLIELTQKRQVFLACQNLLNDLSEATADDVAGRLTQIAIDVSLGHASKQVFDATQLSDRVDQLQDERRDDPGYIRGVRSGYDPLDHVVRGFRQGRLTLLVGATGFGKSTLALNLFRNMALADEPVLLISTENDIDTNLDRMCSMTTGLDVQDVESGANSKRVKGTFREQFANRPAYVSDNSPRSIHEVIGTMTRYVLQKGVKVVFIDYIGEISGAPEKGEKEEQMLARWGQMILDAARSLGCHVVLLAQLNREGNKKGRPSKTELAGCFRLAQKAHTFLIFWQDEDRKQPVLTVDKNRQGSVGVDIAMEFTRSNQRIRALGVWDEESGRTLPIRLTA
jgi:replicative DNA helicase